MKRFAWMLGVLLLLAACSEGNGWTPPPQKWENMSIRIETRPTPVREGMNEFLVIANRQQKGFTSDLVVHISTDGKHWRQAIPDGALGVFRRAEPVRDLDTARLHVRLERTDGKHGELVFPLSAQAAGQ